MSAANSARKRGEFILRYRNPIAAAFIIITLLMAYWAAHVRVATIYDDLLPANHPNVRLYSQYKTSYGRAQTLVLMLRVRNGDIFNIDTLHKIQAVSFGVNRIPGVNHNEVFSLASYRVIYAHAVPGALVLHTFMYPNVPKTQKQVDELKRNVLTHRAQLAGLVTADNKAALIVASFNERGIDYKAAFDGVERMRRQYEDANIHIYASGDLMALAWGYHLLNQILVTFALSVAAMLIIVYLSLGTRTGWWVPIITAMGSAIWGLGFLGVCGFNFDPVMLVIPFIVMARDLSHGIQWQGRYYDELDRNDSLITARSGSTYSASAAVLELGRHEQIRDEDHGAALSETIGAMLPAGLLAILANVAGVIFVSLGDIPVLTHIGIGGALWLASSLAMVFVLQPIMLSYLRPPQARRFGRRTLIRLARNPSLEMFRNWLIRIPVRPGAMRNGLVAAGIMVAMAGLAAARNIPIGYQNSSIPIFRSDSTLNRDYAEISRFMPTSTGWIVLDTPDYPNPQSAIAPNVLRMEHDLGAYLMIRGDVTAVQTFDSLAVRPIDSLLHYGDPKFLATPAENTLTGTIWMMFFSSATSDDIRSFFAKSPAMTTSCIRVLLRDQNYVRLQRVHNEIDDFVRDRVASDPALNQVKMRYLGGDAGVVLATDNVLARLNLLNLLFALATIVVCCALMFRSIAAGILFGAVCVMASVAAFIYMWLRGIGLTIDIIPILSLGAGLGINYGIYIVFRVRDEVRNGYALDAALVTAIGGTGRWVFATFAVMAGGLLPWSFSPLLFHSQMSSMLILLLVANLVAGVLILPAMIAWLRPRFLRPPGQGRREPQSIRAVS
ncbi:MAG: MMPL family transporter [Candidatus Binataceae bacterium]|nr:MMPL family transporter [Candidatus Binataceae bacterium]